MPWSIGRHSVQIPRGLSLTVAEVPLGRHYTVQNRSNAEQRREASIFDVHI